MLKKAIMLAAASMLVMAPAAFADSHDNDGINILNDNNISVLPIQLCGNEIAVIAIPIDLLSPNSSNCVNAPITEDSFNTVDVDGAGHHGHHDHHHHDHHHDYHAGY